MSGGTGGGGAGSGRGVGMGERWKGMMGAGGATIEKPPACGMACTGRGKGIGWAGDESGVFFGSGLSGEGGREKGGTDREGRRGKGDADPNKSLGDRSA